LISIFILKKIILADIIDHTKNFRRGKMQLNIKKDLRGFAISVCIIIAIAVIIGFIKGWVFTFSFVLAFVLIWPIIEASVRILALSFLLFEQLLNLSGIGSLLDNLFDLFLETINSLYNFFSPFGGKLVLKRPKAPPPLTFSESLKNTLKTPLFIRK